MRVKTRYNILSLIVLLCCVLASCDNHSEQTTIEFQNKGHELVYNMIQKVGNYNKLCEKKNVVYTNTYRTPDNKMDISMEKYMFEGELSYGYYKKHDRTFPQLENEFEQGYDGNKYWLKHNGKFLSDSSLLKRVAFNRPTNFYWFTMMQKLLDPGINYEHLGEKTINHQNYDVVKVSFNSSAEEPTDVYQ